MSNCLKRNGARKQPSGHHHQKPGTRHQAPPSKSGAGKKGTATTAALSLLGLSAPARDLQKVRLLREFTPFVPLFFVVLFSHVFSSSDGLAMNLSLTRDTRDPLITRVVDEQQSRKCQADLLGACTPTPTGVFHSSTETEVQATSCQVHTETVLQYTG